MKACQKTEPCTLQQQVEHPHKLKSVGYCALFLHTEAVPSYSILLQKSSCADRWTPFTQKFPPDLQFLTQEMLFLSPQEKTNKKTTTKR